MKKILIILFLFASFYSFGQATTDTLKIQKINAYGYRWDRGIFDYFIRVPINNTDTTDKTAGQIKIYNGLPYWVGTDNYYHSFAGASTGITSVSGTAPITVGSPSSTPIIGLDNTVKVRVTSVSLMQAYTGLADNLTVTDSLRGGDFVLVNSGSLVADGGLIFAATGLGGNNFWVRKYTYGTGVDARWFAVTGDGTTDDHDALVNVINTADAMRVPIFFPSTAVVATAPLVITNKSYIHFISNGATFKALSGSGSGSTFIKFTNVNTLNFQGKFVLDGNYPTANSDNVMDIYAPIADSLSILNIGIFSFKNLPFGGVRILTTDITQNGYGTIKIEQFTCVNAINKRNTAPSNDFNYLYMRGAQQNVDIGRLYWRGDAEVWGDATQSPACKMFAFSAENSSAYPHMKSVNIREVFAEYAVSSVLFFQAVSDVTIGKEALYGTFTKPGIADNLAYTHLGSRSCTFTKFDYASTGRTRNRVKIGSFIMTGTTTIVDTTTNFFIGLWLDEGLEDAYVDQIDADVFCQIYGGNSTTPISGKHFINNLTMRAPARSGQVMALCAKGDIINQVKLINTDAIYSVNGGVIRSIVQEGSQAVTINLTTTTSDSFVVTSDGVYYGASILHGSFTNATVTLTLPYLTSYFDGTDKTHGWKYLLNNISGNVTFAMVFLLDGVNKTASTYANEYENQMKDYVEIQMNNCKWKVSSSGTNIIQRFLFSRPEFLVKKDLTKTSGWTMPLKDNQFNNTYFTTTADNDDTKYLYFNNTGSTTVTGALPTTSLFNYEYIIDNNGANRSQLVTYALNTLGKEFQYVKTTNDAYTITLTPQSGETINGTSSYVMPAHAQTLKIRSDGVSNWQVINLVLWGLEYSGTGSPESSQTAPIGSLYHRLDGSTGTTIYRKESGTGNTGWIASTTSTGTVASVAQSFTGGLISVAGSPITTSGTLALTVAGTSGGIPYFSSTSTWASSASLAANTLVIGGGAGTAPSTTTTGTGVLTALGVNTGSAGSFVVNGGALGTPSSGTLTSATGLPISTGVSGLGTSVATALAVNVGSAGAFITFNGAGGTPSSLTGTNITGTATGLTSGITNALKSATTTVDVSAATAPSSGQVLTATSSTAATWQTPGSGVTTIGTFSSSSIVNGASISGVTVTLGVADGTNPGLLSTVAQSIGGAKTFNGGIIPVSINTSATATSSNFYSPSTSNLGASVSTSQYEINSNATQFRIGIRGSTATVATAANDVWGLLIGNNTFTEATSGTSALAGGVGIVTQTFTDGSGATTNFQNLYVGDAPTGGVSNWSINAGASQFRGVITATGGILGTATNNAATAGNVGEEMNSVISTYANYTTTATYQNVTSITLTAGDWDLAAFYTYSSNSATITAASNAVFVISTTTASAAGATEGQNISYVPQAALLGTSKFSDAITPYRVSLSGSTTYYLNTQATFTLGNPQYTGSIRARRVR